MRACMDRGKRGLGSGGGKGRAVWAVWSVVRRVCMGPFLFLLALSERDLALYLRSPFLLFAQEAGIGAFGVRLGRIDELT